MQILPGIYLINGAPYGRHQNGYWVHRQGATLMVDSGDLHDALTLPEVERNATRWGFCLEQASHLLVTHDHFDHASHAAELQQLRPCAVHRLARASATPAASRACHAWARPCRHRWRPAPPRHGLY